MPDVRVRAATEADLAAIAAIAIATGMDDEWSGTNPDYVRHLMSHGRVVVAAAGETVLGFGAAQQIGTGSAAITMLCDLFVDPAGHGAGSGRAMLAELWRDAPRRMTFSSLHANAMPLYASFGLDAWWPLLYLRGDVRSLPRAAGWRADSASPMRPASSSCGGPAPIAARTTAGGQRARTPPCSPPAVAAVTEVLAARRVRSVHGDRAGAA